MNKDPNRILKPTRMFLPDGNTEDGITTGWYDAMIPCEICITPTRQFKDGTRQWLIFGQFKYATSKEKPSLGTVRAKSLKEARKLTQELLDENFKKFLEEPRRNRD